MYLSATEKTQKETIKERQNKTQNEDEIHLFEALYPRLHGDAFLGAILSEYISGMLVRSEMTAKWFFMQQRTALRNRGGEGDRWKTRAFYLCDRFLFCLKLLYSPRLLSRHV